MQYQIFWSALDWEVLIKTWNLPYGNFTLSNTDFEAGPVDKIMFVINNEKFIFCVKSA